jgi:hypothetical protein
MKPFTDFPPPKYDIPTISETPPKYKKKTKGVEEEESETGFYYTA